MLTLFHSIVFVCGLRFMLCNLSKKQFFIIRDKFCKVVITYNKQYIEFSADFKIRVSKKCFAFNFGLFHLLKVCRDRQSFR